MRWPRRGPNPPPGGNLWAQRIEKAPEPLDPATASLWVHLRTHHAISDRWLAMATRPKAEAWHDLVHADPNLVHGHQHVPVDLPPDLAWPILPEGELDQVHAAYRNAVEARVGNRRVLAALRILLATDMGLRGKPADTRARQRQATWAALSELGVSVDELTEAGNIMREVDAEVQSAARRMGQDPAADEPPR